MFIEYRSAFMDKYWDRFMYPPASRTMHLQIHFLYFSVFAPSVIGSGDDNEEFKKGIAETITKAVDVEFKSTLSSGRRVLWHSKVF